MPSPDAQKIAERAFRELPLATARLTEPYYYASLSLCVLDAVFSIGARYESTFATVRRYCQAFDLPHIRADWTAYPKRLDQESCSALVGRIEELGAPAFAAAIGNRQRTSTRNGVLKAEAAGEFARVLSKFGIEHFQDLPAFAVDTGLEAALKAVRGQASGIAVQYFWMLAGSDDLIKPDRMVIRFLSDSLQRPVAVGEATELVREVTTVVKQTMPTMTPRLLDLVIWQAQRLT